MNDYEQQMMRQRTNTLDTVHVSAKTRPNVCFSINETYNPTYNNDTDASVSPQEQQRHPLMGFNHSKGKWFSQGQTLSPQLQQNNRAQQYYSNNNDSNDDITIERYSSPTFDSNRYFQTRTSQIPIDHSLSIGHQLYVSPYDSPEQLAKTRRFQENLNNILKDLVFKGEKLDFDTHLQVQPKFQLQKQQNVDRWLRENKLTTKFERTNGGILKSSSLPCFFRT